MLADTIERVNKLRKQAMNDPEFIRSSKEHERSIVLNEKRTSADNCQVNKTPKRFDKVFKQAEFGVNPSGVTH